MTQPSSLLTGQAQCRRFQVVACSGHRVTSLVLSEQVRLASVRRSLFTGETERSAFLARLVTGTRDVLRSNQGLAEHANYHEFCRLLGRLKTNYQLSELVRSQLAPLLTRALDE